VHAWFDPNTPDSIFVLRGGEYFVLSECWSFELVVCAKFPSPGCIGGEISIPVTTAAGVALDAY
jgi:hypothetical protein